MSYQPPYGAPPQQQYGAPPPGQQYPPQGQPGYPHQQQYGAPPPHGQYPPQQQYGAPPGPPPPVGQPPYGAPSPQPGYPPQQQYGAPPPGQYQQYPPQQQYGAPPPAGQPPYGGLSPQPGAPYGAPPLGQYQQYPPQGQPGYPPQQPYVAPPQQSYATPDQPSLGYSSTPPQIQYDATADAKALRKAMKGFGTDEKALIAVLCDKDPLQVAVLRQTYNYTQSRDLLADLKSELGGYFEELMMGIVRGPLGQDVYVLYQAMKGPGTDEEALNDVLLSRSNADIAAIKQQYQATYRRSLEADLKSDLSMKTERHFLMVVAGNRAESSAPVIPQQIDADVLEIYKATEGKMGTDELQVCQILTSRNDAQIGAIARSYEQKYRKSLESVIKSEFSGHMERALLHQLRSGTDRVLRDALLLEDSMKGMGTKERLLLNRVLRAHWNRNHMNQVKICYKQKYHQTLSSRVEGEVSGDLERGLVACLGRD